ncbi:DUF2974 domain-containing protein [Alloscardovia theropitheci]|uniref:DUF2974 domain-containing protein n=1 Tax=Alloscardovia theropitheci TaxID=2496842 RepID=A0A4R0QRH6_9BIFI|nr:Mbeg1-like protein [Alloscardovia theropitheci]TCD54964.1 DUF2974 domain-containing protein [Alloscardovia theropitheci]
MSNSYTEEDRKEIANIEYQDYTNSDARNHHNVTFGEKNTTLGTLDKVVNDEKTGLKMYVVKSDDQHYTVLYRGSEAPPKHGSWVDWVDNDIPMAQRIMSGQKGVTPQISQAADELQKLMKEHPDASFDVYGHSLGSMCAQYAAAKVTNPSRINGVYAYEGPNIYPTLTKDEKHNVLRLRGKIHNYVDPKDAVPLGYSSRLGMVGRMHKVNSKWASPIDQHMWGGYQWQDDGGLAETKPNLNEMKAAFSYYRSQHPKFSKSASGKLILDYVQAQYLSDALVADASSAETDIENLRNRELNDLEQQLSQAIATIKSNLYTLSSDEIDAVISAHGLTISKLKEKLQSTSQTAIDKASSISGDFEELRETINTGMNKAMETDSKLASGMDEFMDSYDLMMLMPPLN